MKTPSTAATATFGLEPAGYRQLLERFAQAKRILVYSGAGMSADSGLPTYRGAGEHLWTGDTVRRVATLRGYKRNPAFAVAWYIEQSRHLHAARPHEGHQALHALERHWQVTHVTQNVDTLLEQAGCADIVHLHGRYDELKCLNCDWHERATHPEELQRPCPKCGGQLRPDIVWLGEIPDQGLVARSEAAARHADLVLVVGTPAEMYPGAAIVETAHRAGAAICVINPEWCENLHYAQWQLFGTAGAVLPGLVRAAVARRHTEGKGVPGYWRWLVDWVK